MLTSGCIHSGLLMYPSLNYGVSMRNTTSKLYLKKMTLVFNATAPVIKECTQGPCDLQMDDYKSWSSTMAKINDTHILFGSRLGYFNHTKMDGLTTMPLDAYRFTYVICIDASTCIAADDSKTKLSYYNISNNFLKGGNSVTEVKVINSINHGGVVGIAGNSTQTVVIICTASNCYIRNYANNTLVSFSTAGDAKSFAAVFNSTNPQELVLVVSYKSLLKLFKPLNPNFNASGAAPFTTVPLAYDWVVQLRSTDDGRYISVTFWMSNKLFLYEKKPCHTSCATCSGPNDMNCLTCAGPGQLWLDAITSKCSFCSGTNEVKFDNMTCGRCATGCTSCSPSNISNCSGCTTPPYYKVTGANSCVTCLVNTSVIDGYACKPCASPCLTCFNTSTNCTSCVGGYCLNTTISTGVCNLNSSVGAGFYLYKGGGITKCGKCQSGCTLCSTENTCNNCTAGMYWDNSANGCQSCPSNCSACNAADNCISCKPGGHLLPVSGKGVCDACTANHRFVTEDDKCDYCDPMCGNCLGTSTNCTNCSTAGQYVSSVNGTCVYCVAGSYVNNYTQRCTPCDPTCLTCSDASTCTSCNSSNYLYLFENNTCGVCSYDGFLLINEKCFPCDRNCSKCYALANHCTSCEDDKTFTVSATNFTCDFCGDGYFVHPTDKMCYKCDNSCATCSVNSTNCKSCLDGLYINSSLGCGDCADNGYGIIYESCVQCDPLNNCSRCDDDPTTCSECSGNLTIMTADNNKCGNNCNATGGSYIETVSGVSYCKQCDSSCAQCSLISTNCTDCDSDKHLIDSQCVTCSPNCISCTTPSNCLECAAGYLMLPDSSCISQSKCKQNASRFASGLRCNDCSPSCKSCFGSAASCTSCIAGQYLSATNTCVPCTENGYYHNSTNCLQCDSSCLTCNGSTSTDCLSCLPTLVLTDERSCLTIPPLLLKSAAFKSDMELATFTFDHEIKVRTEKPAIGLYSCPSSSLEPFLKNSTELPMSGSGCEPFGEWSLKDVSFDGTYFKVKLLIQKSIEGGTLVLRAPEEHWWQAQSNKLVRYSEDYLIVENVTVIKSALDGMMDSAAAPAAAAMTTVQLVVMTVSLPQAFILMKVLQTLDYYIYIDCDYPSNFAKFLDMITNSAFDYLPNFFEMLVDNDGLPLYERFAEYGMKVHIFANLGQIYSVAMILGVLKLLLLLVKKVWSKATRYYNMIEPDLFFGIFESYHLDSMLSIIIFIANRERINNRQDAVKYLVIVFVSLFSLFMISMYLFMGYTVSRLTDSYFKHAVVEVKNMKNESWKFLLEDKNMHGNIFQRHFNLIQLFKDIVFAALLYALYYKPLVLIILLTLIQAVFMACVFAYPPYNIAWMNLSLRITQVLYLLLDLFFVLLIGWGAQFTEKTRYYFIGFAMIFLVLLILACNIGFSLYSTYKMLKIKYQKYKAKKEKMLKNPSTRSLKDFNVSSIDRSELSSIQHLPNETSFSTQSKKPPLAILRNKTPVSRRNGDSPLLSSTSGSKRSRVVPSPKTRVLRKTTKSELETENLTKEVSQKTMPSSGKVKVKKVRPTVTLTSSAQNEVSIEASALTKTSLNQHRKKGAKADISRRAKKD